MKTYRITGELKVRSVNGQDGGPLHLGAPSEQADYVDRLVYRDSLDYPVLAGTSLCGVMAEMARASLRAAGATQPEAHPAFIALFGSARGKHKKEGQESRLKVFNTRLKKSEALVRDRNGINRERGSADYKRLFHEEVIDGAWSFPVIMDLTETGPRTDEEQKNGINFDPDTLARRLLFDILCLFEAGWTNIGGNSSIGYGRFKLDNSFVKIWDRTEPAQILAFAKDRWEANDKNDKPVFPSKPIKSVFDSNNVINVNNKGNICPSDRIRFHCTLRPLEPLLIKTGYTAEVCNSIGSKRAEEEELKLKYKTVDQEFAVDAGFCLNAYKQPYVPGSSLRGVMRSRAEYVVRTIVNNDRSAWNLQYAQEQGEKFSKLKRYEEDDVECLVSRIFGFSGLGGRILFSDAIPMDPSNFEKGRKLIDNVALDRFSGGAADKYKFNARPFFPSGPPEKADSTGDLKCEIELRDFEPWQLGMLLLLLRDLYLGRIILGYGKNKGYGRIRLVQVEMEVLGSPNGFFQESLPDDASSLGGFKTFSDKLGFDNGGYLCPTQNQGLTTVYRNAEEAMRDQMRNWQPANLEDDERSVLEI